MGKETGIKWTDSTFNSWHGCTKCGPACDHCYAEGVDKRGGGEHWGLGAERRLLSEHARHEPYRWNRNADKFFAEHGRRQRVFTLSMGDLFDKEVSDDWRAGHTRTMTDTPLLEYQICTKRVSNIARMVPQSWTPTMEHGPRWPKHIGVLITVVTQAEADRDVPRLLELKKRFGIPWVGVSYEPAQEAIDFRHLMWLDGASLDWIIFGGKSGGRWNDRPFNVEWARPLMELCALEGAAFFMKQVAAFRPTDAMIPADLLIRQWPRGH